MFSKKIIVLKQATDGYSSGTKPACGICRLEKENDVLTVFLSLIGFAALSSGEYRLYVVGDDKTLFKKELGKIPTSAAFTFQSEINLDGGVSAGIWTVKDDIPLMVAYQKSDGARLSVKDYGACVINDVISERRIREREKEFRLPPDEIKEDGETDNKGVTEPLGFSENGIAEYFPRPSEYDDEAVATENYYEKDEEIRRKLSDVKELCDEYVRREDDDGYRVSTQKNHQSEKNFDSDENERNDKGSEKAPYYLKVKGELDGIFDRFPAETDLERLFTESRWAKVYYAENKFYVVGVVKENGCEKYVCYGVPSHYKPTPPKELAGYCSFVPLSLFDLKGEGYFMMFQDAFTGKCVKMG